LFGLFVFENSSANRLVCNNDGMAFQNNTVYKVENCTVTEIELGDEHARTSLKYVKAINNQISRISDDTFKSAKELTHIDLRENKIQEISVRAFKDQGKLQHLYLKQNKLTRIEVGTFDSLTGLKDLWLQNNQLSLIEKGLFDKNLKLEYLFLNENKIVAIESTVFQNLNQAVDIRFEGNLCSNETSKSNKFDQNFTCFKNYKILKPYLDQIHQLKSKSKNCNNDKSACKTENERLKQNLATNSIDLSQCETEKSSIKEEKIDLAAKLESKESELNETLGEKSTCLAEKDTTKKALNEKLKKLSTCSNNLSDCQRENFVIYQQRENLTEQLNTCQSKKCPDISFYILICFVTVDFLIIILFMWKFVTKKRKSKISSNIDEVESQPAVQRHPNANNLIYATLDLKPSTRIPIRTDQVIYSKVQ
jgi:Leucine-rich repeat (LRR) protein